MMVYQDEAGQERGWLMQKTSVVEFLALLLRGRMWRGRRVVIDKAEVTIEPPDKPGGLPALCLATGLLVSCAPLEHASLEALRDDINAVLRP